MILAWSATVALAAPQFPPLSGRVVDGAGLLSASTETSIDRLSSELEAKTGSQLVVVTLPDLQGYEIEEFGYQLGRAWGLGAKGEDDGLVLIVAKQERKVRVEVGYGLEGAVTDAFSSYVIQRDVVPRFKSGDFDGGVLAGATALAEQVGADPDRQKAALQRAEADQAPSIPPQLVFLGLLIAFVVLSNLVNGRRGRRYRGGFAGAAPVIVWGGGGHSGGGWGGGGGGGGFSGGGGSFGGGGASGSW